ncbi:putative zinc dependent protease (plasmid) [Alkalihalophilus pseudofirmus OF4]|uniref:Zinc dependent protease n=1 Tax=Alkalihalophilus pseudofirmus (strain ATCC BAA-2126 / JCM 17055 / OF4) TaxID=398511 RepID=D3G1P5_ALKPO|nr:DUF2268 domain-containing putative Zn-dependent protease [Alkalihalophilus pseudofirmus]ADC52271.1 putative zinc dependent protease [Alkalihalophilus pseudofirmus OF4]
MAVNILDTKHIFVGLIKGSQDMNLEDNINKCQLDYSYQELLAFGLVNENVSLPYLREYIDFLDTLNIEGIIKKAINIVATHTKAIQTNIVILPLDPQNQFYIHYMGGIVAHTNGANTIYIYLSPSNKLKSFVNRLESIIVHEYQHILRNYHSSPNATLLDVLIDEGLSELFVKVLLGEDRLGAWAKWNSNNIIKKNKELIEEYLYTTNPHTIRTIMNGSEELGIPLWLGYSVGFSILDFHWLNKNNDLNALVKMKAEEIYNHDSF